MKRLFAVLVVLLAACGSSSKPQPVAVAPTSPTSMAATPDLAALGQKYLDIVKPANDALAAMTAEWKKVPSDATGPDLAKLAAPAVVAMQTQDQALLRVAWPAAIQVDVRALVTADAAAMGDLQSIGAQNGLTVGNWATQFVADAAKSTAAASVVRADLGLPPPAS